jgi:redox-sensitive bicupin YhaK (pirin superfamily)
MTTPDPSSTIRHVYQAHAHDLGGGFVVRRLLPGQPQQGVGPFIFFDHFGPTTIAAGQNVDVRPHPHIGLATVTYLFEGAMLHRDHLGTVQRIEPGAVNWMLAGRGIVHSERVPDDLRRRPWTSHGLQLWVAQPLAHEEDAPSFHHAAAGDLPEAELGAVQVRVLLGRAFGLESPVPVHSPLAYVHARWLHAGPWTVTRDLTERAIYPVRGVVDVGGTTLQAGQMALLAPGQTVEVRADADAEAVLIAGEPLDGPRFIHWNFASSRRERIEQARADWAAERFPTIPGDDRERIPLPAR